MGGLVVGIVLLAAFASGCGGDSATSSSLTRPEFIKQANAACAKRHQVWQTSLASYNKQVKERNATAEPQVQEEIATELLEEEMLPAVRKQLEALEALPAPDGEEDVISKILATLSQELNKVEKDPIKALAKSHNFETFEEESKEYGLNCSFN
jgi:hypothetical protein